MNLLIHTEKVYWFTFTDLRSTKCHLENNIYRSRLLDIAAYSVLKSGKLYQIYINYFGQER